MPADKNTLPALWCCRVFGVQKLVGEIRTLSRWGLVGAEIQSAAYELLRTRLGSTLAIWSCNTPHQSDLLRRPLGLLRVVRAHQYAKCRSIKVPRGGCQTRFEKVAEGAKSPIIMVSRKEASRSSPLAYLGKERIYLFSHLFSGFSPVRRIPFALLVIVPALIPQWASLRSLYSSYAGSFLHGSILLTTYSPVWVRVA
jgi:hypothetical protein